MHVAELLMSDIQKNDMWPEDGYENLGYCPICRNRQRTLLHQVLADYAFNCAPGRWVMYRCDQCGVGYLDPRPNLATIGLAYERYYTHQVNACGNPAIQTMKLAMANGYRNYKFGSKLKPSTMLGKMYCCFFSDKRAEIDAEARGLESEPVGRVLDVGCGNGQFLHLAQSMGWQAFGVEPDEQAARIARDYGIQILGRFIEDVPREYDNSFNTITLNHVIEHVHDPLKLLSLCQRLLRPEGRLWIETPNLDSEGHHQYGQFWRGLEPPRHLVVFGWDGLRKGLELTGFVDIRRMHPRPARKWMFKQSELAKRQFMSEEEAGIYQLPHEPTHDDLTLDSALIRHELLAVNAGKVGAA